MDQFGLGADQVSAMACEPVTLAVSRVGAKTVAGSLKYWVNHSVLPADDILADAQNEIYARLRVREMRASTDIVVAIGDFKTNVPADFLDPISFKDNFKSDIALRDPDVLEDMRAFDSSGNLIQGPISDYAIFDEALPLIRRLGRAASWVYSGGQGD